ncbi:MAG: thiamine diphosphokinase, partial [Oscillospiraceae bacterium]|nr:thiamine diphosphokinase [Oscillospiraceae bacterium]
HIYGGTGGRLDHTLANIQCIAALAQTGARGFIYDRDAVITAVHNGAISFPPGARGVVSVLCHSDRAVGVTERGLKYALTDAELTGAHPLGISNEFTGAPASISVRSGTLVVIYPKDVQAIFA